MHLFLNIVTPLLGLDGTELDAAASGSKQKGYNLNISLRFTVMMCIFPSINSPNGRASLGGKMENASTVAWGGLEL